MSSCQDRVSQGLKTSYSYDCSDGECVQPPMPQAARGLRLSSLRGESARASNIGTKGSTTSSLADVLKTQMRSLAADAAVVDELVVHCLAVSGMHEAAGCSRVPAW
jgi:hypothetical protein